MNTKQMMILKILLNCRMKMLLLKTGDNATNCNISSKNLNNELGIPLYFKKENVSI